MKKINKFINDNNISRGCIFSLVLSSVINLVLLFHEDYLKPSGVFLDWLSWFNIPGIVLCLMSSICSFWSAEPIKVISFNFVFYFFVGLIIYLFWKKLKKVNEI